MIPLLCAAALMDTMLVPDDYDVVTIHEWGVITVSESTIDVSGYPHQETAYDPELDDRAPVVYFYGSEFSNAVFTITLNSGEFTDFHPLPDEMNEGGTTASWSIISGSDLGTTPISDEYIPETSASLLWNMDHWRDGGSHVLEFSGGSLDKFIYYECSLPLTSESPLPPFSSSGGLASEYNGEVMVFTLEGGNGMKTALCRWPDMMAGTQDMETYDREAVLALLCSWAGGRAKGHELEDLWASWEGYIMDECRNCDRLLLFPIPSSSIEAFSRLNLVTEDEHEVFTERFFIGILPFNWLG